MRLTMLLFNRTGTQLTEVEPSSKRRHVKRMLAARRDTRSREILTCSMTCIVNRIHSCHLEARLYQPRAITIRSDWPQKPQYAIGFANQHKIKSCLPCLSFAVHSTHKCLEHHSEAGTLSRIAMSSSTTVDETPNTALAASVMDELHLGANPPEDEYAGDLPPAYNTF